MRNHGLDSLLCCCFFWSKAFQPRPSGSHTLFFMCLCVFGDENVKMVPKKTRHFSKRSQVGRSDSPMAPLGPSGPHGPRGPPAAWPGGAAYGPKPGLRNPSGEDAEFCFWVLDGFYEKPVSLWFQHYIQYVPIYMYIYIYNYI